MMYLWPLRKPRWLRAAGSSGEVRRSAEVHQATCHSLYRSHHAAPAFGVCAELSWDSHHAVSCCLFWSPVVPLLAQSHPCDPTQPVPIPVFQVGKGHSSISAPGVGKGRGRCGAGTQKLSHTSAPQLSQKMRNKPSPAESLQIPALSTHIHAEI